ncbi:MAG: hypothetical protein OSB38_15130 [Paraburkholderia fungorum]|nr:hypothetical protein [Paraburkholderia fungorum]
MQNYAVVSNGVVENVIVWDGESEYPDSAALISLASNPEVCPGYSYNGTTFSPPASQAASDGV